MFKQLDSFLSNTSSPQSFFYTHICCFNFDALAQGNVYNQVNPQKNWEIIMDQAGIDLTTFRHIPSATQL